MRENRRAFFGGNSLGQTSQLLCRTLEGTLHSSLRSETYKISQLAKFDFDPKVPSRTLCEKSQKEKKQRISHKNPNRDLHINLTLQELLDTFREKSQGKALTT